MQDFGPVMADLDRQSVAWACAAIKRNPWGPLSQRRQISAPSVGPDRKIVIPASSKCHGRLRSIG